MSLGAMSGRGLDSNSSSQEDLRLGGSRASPNIMSGRLGPNCFNCLVHSIYVTLCRCAVSLNAFDLSVVSQLNDLESNRKGC